RRRFDGDVHVAELFVAGERPPCAGVAGELPGVVTLVVLAPCFDAEFPGLGNGVEGPEQLACADIVAADVAGGIFAGGQRDAYSESSADNGDIADDDWRRGGSNRSFFDFGSVEAKPEINVAAIAEVGNRRAGFRVQR